MNKTKAYLTAVLCFVICIFMMSAQVFAAGKNIASEATVEANSYIAEDQSPEMINDGDIETKWCSVEPVEGTETDYWIVFNFGTKRTFDKYILKSAPLMTIDSGHPEYVTYAFKVEYSDDNATWTTINSVEGNEENTFEHSFDAVTAQYVRFYVTKPTNSTDKAVRVPEFEIYEVEGATPVPTTAAPTPEPTTAAPTTEAPTTEAPTTAAPTDSNNDNNTDGLSPVIWIVIGGVVVAAGVVFFIAKSKKK